jgi:GNAT superfamily N-acetyltransferase
MACGRDPTRLDVDPADPRGKDIEMTRTIDITGHRGPAAVTLRELGPDEHDVLDVVFAGLSPTSRYRRFHAPIRRLSGSMRTHLGAVDGHRHLAVAAFAAGGAPIGIARLIGFGCGPPGRVELAVEVVDAWQRRGVGSRLVREVLARGRAAGHREVVAAVLAENFGMQMLLFAVLPDLTWVQDGPELTFTGTLAGPPQGDPALAGVAA